MSIASYASLQAKLAAPLQRLIISKTNVGMNVGRFRSTWTGGPQPGVAPTAAVVPTSATPGAVGVSGQVMQNASTAQRLGRVVASCATAASLTLYDRLSHQGGLSGIVTGAQTTNLPTAALTRYTSGIGVMLMLEIYASVGSVSTTVTASYTNSSGVAGRTTPLILIGTAAEALVNQCLILPLQIGDVGVKSCESVTLAASTTQAGNLGCTLIRPLMTLNNLLSFDRQVVFEAAQNLSLCFPKIQPNACLSWLVGGNVTTSPLIVARLDFIQE